MSERPLQVGDVCELVWCHYPQNQHLVGVQFTLLEGPSECMSHDGMQYIGFQTTLMAHGSSFVDIKQIRRIPPKDEPKSDFTPADEDFTKDLLKQLGVHA